MAKVRWTVSRIGDWPNYPDAKSLEPADMTLRQAVITPGAVELLENGQKLYKVEGHYFYTWR